MCVIQLIRGGARGKVLSSQGHVVRAPAMESRCPLLISIQSNGDSLTWDLYKTIAAVFCVCVCRYFPPRCRKLEARV
jgi:hypothetical protein